MTEKDIDVFRKKIEGIVHSDEGKKAIKTAIKNAVRAKTEFDEGTRTNIENLYKPMTV